MEEFTIERVQNLEYGILCYIKEVCDKHDLKYYLTYGTLIGAVRHHGFIPWDDDIDIFMPREDFDRFVKITNAEPHDYYKVVCRENNKDFTAPLPKVIDSRTRLIQHYGFIEKVELGVYIDIFLIDGAGNSAAEAETIYNESYELYKRWVRSDTEMFTPNQSRLKSFIRWLKHFPERTKGIYYWLDRIEEHNSKRSFYKDRYIGALEAGTPQAVRNVWPKEYLGEGIEMQFGDSMFRVPDNYDALLRVEYGDYMQLPPEEKRASHHKYNLSWSDGSQQNRN